MNSKADKGVVAATRIAAGDDRSRYDDLAILLHWVTVALVLIQFGLAELWDHAAEPTKHLMIVGHMSFGILLAAIVLLRIVWRLLPGHKVRSAVTGIVEIAAKFAHYLLYALLVAQAALGFALRWSGHRPMSFFGFLIPSFFSPLSKSARHLIADAHNYAGWAIIILAAGHGLAALFHHFVLRDDVLLRMLPAHVAARARR